MLSIVKEPQKNGKTINWCRVDVGPEHNDAEGARGIVCGAHNFVEGDLVVVSLPGTVLPALAVCEISARKTYGHVSDGMICSSAELGSAGDASGIIVLEPGSAAPGDDAIALLGLGNEVLDLEVNPDRGYALSMRGVGRDTALAYGLEFADPADIEVTGTGEGYPVRVEDAEAARSSRRAPSRASTRPGRPRRGWPTASSRPACGPSRSRSTSPTTSCSRSATRSTASTCRACRARSSSGGRPRARSSRRSTASCVRCRPTTPW